MNPDWTATIGFTDSVGYLFFTMIFDDFITLCSTSRFINLVFADGSDVLVTASIPASSDKDGRFCELDRTEGYDYVIRRLDVSKAKADGLGFKLTVLVYDDVMAEESDEIEYDGEMFTPKEATVYFLGLSTLDPAKMLVNAVAEGIAAK